MSFVSSKSIYFWLHLTFLMYRASPFSISKFQLDARRLHLEEYFRLKKCKFKMKNDESSCKENILLSPKNYALLSHERHTRLWTRSVCKNTSLHFVRIFSINYENDMTNLVVDNRNT